MSLSAERSVTELVREELNRYSGKDAYFDPLWGNNGDSLIRMGSEHVLQDAGVHLVRQPAKSQVIIVNGSGGMNDLSGSGWKALLYYNEQYPHVPLLVLPQSYLFQKMDFPSMFANRTAPAILYAREKYSFDFLHTLRFPGQVEIRLDHDMAFSLRDTAYMRDLRARAANRHILIVERADHESITGLREQAMRLPLKRYIPQSLKLFIKRSLAARRIKTAPQSVFVRSSLDRLLKEKPGLSDLPIYAADISSQGICSFNNFGLMIAQAAAVVTTRLHVGILAAMLGKPTYMVGGTYHKIKGIYEYSLAHESHVHFLP